MKFSKEKSQSTNEEMAAIKRQLQEKSQFLAAASHDLRQPLQTLGLLHDALTKQTQNLASLLAQLGESLRSMESLLNSLLDISRLENGTLASQTTVFPSAEVLNPLQAVFEPQARQKGLALKVRSCSVMLRSEKSFLEQILHNFIANAIKYTEKGKILVGCRRRSNLRIEVWDTGIGIPQDQLEMIFKGFYQVGGPTRNLHKSREQGLGLAIVQHLACRLGHPLCVRSIPGRGSIVVLSISYPRK